MSRPGPVLRFFGIAALVFGALLAAWPVLAAPYQWAFRTGAQIAFQFVWFGSEVVLEPDPRSGDPFDTQIRVVERDGAASWAAATETRGAGYLPAIVFVALVAATPIPRRRRLRGLLIGGALVYAYVVFLLWLNLMDGLGNHAGGCRLPDQHAAFLQSEGWRRGVHTALAALRLEPTTFVLVPVLAWAASCLGWNDVERLLRRSPPPEEAGR